MNNSKKSFEWKMREVLSHVWKVVNSQKSLWISRVFILFVLLFLYYYVRYFCFVFVFIDLFIELVTYM